MKKIYKVMYHRHGQHETRSRQDGFTLLEVIVSMTILSLVTVLIGSGFRLALDSWDKGEAETVWTQRLRVLSMLMSQQLKSAYPYKIDSDDESVVLFKGKSDSILFVTTLSEVSYGGFKWVRYAYKDETLFYNEGVLPDKKIEDKKFTDDEIIDENLDEFLFEYFSFEDGEWKESWEDGKELPGAVRIKISNFQPFSISIPLSGKDEKDDNNRGL